MGEFDVLGDSYQADLDERQEALDLAWGAPELLNERDPFDYLPVPFRASEFSDPELVP